MRNVGRDVAKYIEGGIGTRWLVRTETEHADGTESEHRGVERLSVVRGVYLRVWLRKTVYVISTRDGFKQNRKSRIAFKGVVGIEGD